MCDYNKEESEIVDVPGKNILNWMISYFIYLIGGGVLGVILIGLPIIFAALYVL